MKKLSLILVTVFAVSSMNVSANTYEEISSALVNTVASDLNQVRETIQSQVKQSITDSIADFFENETKSTEESLNIEQDRGE